MRLLRSAFGLCLLLASGFASAYAAGIEIAANDCPGGPAATTHLVDACASDDGHAMEVVVSFVPPVDIPELLELSTEILVITWDPYGEQRPLPDWWRLQPGGCRAGAATLDVSVPSGSVCSDPWTGLQPDITTVVEEVPFLGSSLTVLRVVVEIAFPALPPPSLQGGTKYQAFTLRIDRRATSLCGGCCGAACIHLMESVLRPRSGDALRLTPGAQGDMISWQQGETTLEGGCFGPDCVVATRRKAWGELKALYR